METAPYLLSAPGDVVGAMVDVVKAAGTELSKWKKGNSNEFWALTFLMNLSQSEHSVKPMQRAGVGALLEALVHQPGKETLHAAITLAFISRDDRTGGTLKR